MISDNCKMEPYGKNPAIYSGFYIWVAGLGGGTRVSSKS